jgi:outer membrane lipoprotein-sorting protein
MNMVSNQLKTPKHHLPVLSLVAFLIVLAIFLTACGGNTTPTVSSPTSAAAPANTAYPAAAAPAVPPTMVAYPAAGANAAAPTASASTNPNEAYPAAGSTPAAPAAASGDAKQALLAVMKNMLTAGPYRAKSTTTGGAKPVETTAEVILPDRFHVSINNQEFIIIGKTTYMQQGGKWGVFPMDVGSIVTGLIGTLTADQENDISNVKVVGPDTLNGIPTTVYLYDSSATISGITAKSTVKMWVDNAKNLPIQQQVDGEANGVKSTTMQTITYDPSIKIEDPTK